VALLEKEHFSRPDDRDTRELFSSGFADMEGLLNITRETAGNAMIENCTT